MAPRRTLPEPRPLRRRGDARVRGVHLPSNHRKVHPPPACTTLAVEERQKRETSGKRAISRILRARTAPNVKEGVGNLTLLGLLIDALGRKSLSQVVHSHHLALKLLLAAPNRFKGNVSGTKTESRHLATVGGARSDQPQKEPQLCVGGNQSTALASASRAATRPPRVWALQRKRVGGGGENHLLAGGNFNIRGTKGNHDQQRRHGPHKEGSNHPRPRPRHFVPETAQKVSSRIDSRDLWNLIVSSQIRCFLPAEN